MSEQVNRVPVALTIAGSDSGGNAGIQADIRAFHVFKLHACTVITALTAQNPYGVRAVQVAEPDFVKSQLDAVLEEYAVGALKTGMLATAGVIDAVATELAKYPDVKKIVDPVMIATSGAKLLQDDAIEAMKTRLLPLATLITPNIPEAEVLLERTITSQDEMVQAAKDLHAQLGCAVLIKGGHHTSMTAEDVLFDGHEVRWYQTDVVENPLSTHGTGCSLSAAIAASCARGNGLQDAVREGKQYVYEAIRTGVYVGERATVLGTPTGDEVIRR